MLEYTSQRKFNKEFKEIWSLKSLKKYERMYLLSLKLILKGKGGKKDWLPICYF